MTEPWADLRHSMSHLYVLVENPDMRTRPGSRERYAAAELDLPHARRFQADLNRRMGDLERVDAPSISPDDDYDRLYTLYKEHLAKEQAYQREVNTRLAELEKRTLLFQQYLKPHWDQMADTTR